MKRNKCNSKINEFSSKRLPNYVALLLVLLIFSYMGNAQSRYAQKCLDGFSSENRGDLDDAIKLYSEAIALNPTTAEAYGYRANAYVISLQFENAIADVNKAISFNPTSLVLHHLRANCFFETSSYQNAIADYSYAISSGKESSYTGIYPATDNKQMSDLYFRRGKSLYFMHEYQSAINDFTHALKIATRLKTQTDYIYYWRGRCNVELLNYSEAINDLEISIIGFPKDLKMQNYLGFSYYKSGNIEKAKQVAQKLIELEPSNENNFSGNNLLSIFDLTKRRVAASQYYSKAKAKVDDLKNVTTAYFIGIKANEAFPYLDSAWFMAPKINDEDLQLRDSIIEAYLVVYPKLKDKPEIPENIRRYIVQATNATEEHDYDKSIELWGKVISIIPYNPMAYYNLALIWEFKNNYNYAIKDMKEYLRLAPDAGDARGAQDKIYLWESKTTSQNSSSKYDYYPDITSQLRTKTNQSLGMYHVALAIGMGVGFLSGDNTALADAWNHLDGHSAKEEYKYGGNFRLAYSGDAELLIRPIPRFAFGGFGRIMGGVGKSTTISTEDHNLNLASFQYGGMARLFLTLNDLGDSPDFYLQFKYGVNEIDGYYDKSVNYSVSYSKSITGSAPIMAFGLGFGGKVGKVSYISMDLEYFSSTVDMLNAKVTVDDGVPSTIGQTGKFAPAVFSGLMLRFMLLGFCF